MDSKNFIETITMSDFRPGSDVRLIAEKLGVETAVKIINELGGINFYIPRNALRDAADRFILQNIKRSTVKELVAATGASERYIYDLLAKQKQTTDDKSINLFEEYHES